VRHDCYIVFQLAGVTMQRVLLTNILCRIDRLRGPPVAVA
jgi:hypothetical protein